MAAEIVDQLFKLRAYFIGAEWAAQLQAAG
jgi:hypothetical protein